MKSVDHYLCMGELASCSLMIGRPHVYGNETDGLSFLRAQCWLSQPGFVIHHVKGSLWPHEVGQDLKRFVKISENRLIITTPPIQRGGKEWFNRITFERVEKGK
jgi:hypothetical protein